MSSTSIEWTATHHPDGTVTPGCTINPIRARLRDSAHAGLTKGGYGSGVGHYCEKVSSGCAHCYSSQSQPRFGMPEFPGVQKGEPAVEVFFDDSRLHEVLRRKTPTKFFWLDMSDLFGKWVPDHWIDKCFAVMALTPQHIHQVLTKRPERMASYLSSHGLNRSRHEDVQGEAYTLSCGFDQPSDWDDLIDHMPWPLPQVWLGTSCEDQQRADERIPHLLRCPAAVRFLSVEPLLGPVDLTHLTDPAAGTGEWDYRYWDCLTGENWCDCNDFIRPVGTGPVSWVIAGAESGPRRRPMRTEWAESLAEQCREAGTAFFMKQMEVEGKVTGDMNLFPESLRIREWPTTAEAAS